ncbi:MAG: L-seryl-tRNA(Sec) selenium transferase, partial [Clostridia bacterium]|nr:L-seryl-tRNA(Sec) selenium transferase [Clostridia bacterium]
MENKAALLRAIPKMDVLLAEDEIRSLMEESSEALVLKSLRTAVDEVRAAILDGSGEEPTVEHIISVCKEKLADSNRMNQRVVTNATGVLLHTNLGRSLLAESAAEAVYRAAVNYTTLEFDCATGGRGDRYSHVEGLVCELFGVESAVVVNNNAAAVLLLLTAVAKGKEVVVSRGELVEIGGSFRVPEVMEQSGCILHEVGTTNKTHPADYERAINENTAALLKVHTSNYRVIGFTEDVDLAELSAIAKRNGL